MQGTPLPTPKNYNPTTQYLEAVSVKRRVKKVLCRAYNLTPKKYSKLTDTQKAILWKRLEAHAASVNT